MAHMDPSDTSGEHYDQGIPYGVKGKTPQNIDPTIDNWLRNLLGGEGGPLGVLPQSPTLAPTQGSLASGQQLGVRAEPLALSRPIPENINPPPPPPIPEQRIAPAADSDTSAIGNLLPPSTAPATAQPTGADAGGTTAEAQAARGVPMPQPELPPPAQTPTAQDVIANLQGLDPLGQDFMNVPTQAYDAMIAEGDLDPYAGHADTQLGDSIVPQQTSFTSPLVPEGVTTVDVPEEGGTGIDALINDLGLLDEGMDDMARLRAMGHLPLSIKQQIIARIEEMEESANVGITDTPAPEGADAIDYGV